LSKMWSGRVSQPLDEQFDQWQRSIGFDCSLISPECAASRAYAFALAKAGVLTQAEAEQIEKALEDIVREVFRGDPDFGDAEDVHHYVERQLSRKLGDIGRKLHTGRSRNEQIATDLRLYVILTSSDMRHALAEVCGALIARAKALGEAVMPAYTHMQRAEPVLAAHWLLAYVEMFLRDAERISDCEKRVRVMPLGSGAVAGCTVAIDREALARELMFTSVSANSMDATSDRDFAIEYVNALALVALHLSRFAEDIVLYTTAEFGFVKLPDSFATGSSAMPQKKNPDFAELLRGKTARVLACAQQLAITMKGLPLAYNRDMQETQEPLFSATSSVLQSLVLAARFIAAIEFDRARMAEAASTGYLNATAAANYLVRKGVPFRSAHEIIGAAVRQALEKKCELQQLALDDLKKLTPQFDTDFPAALALPHVLAEHDVPGGTAPARVQQAIADAERRTTILAASEEACAHA